MSDLAAGNPRMEKKSSKKKKGVKKSAKSAENENQERKAELERRLRKQLAYERAAHDLTLKLIDQTVDGVTLIQSVLQMSVSHFQDVAEERAIGHLCGYPLCGNLIRKKVTQKYHISTRTNQVIDLTERKNFCSNFCYKAFKYLEAQIPSSPVWAREEEDKPLIKLLDAANSPSIQVSVVKNPRMELKSEVEQLEKTGQTDRLKMGPSELLSSQENSKGSENGNTLDFLSSLRAAREDKKNAVVRAEHRVTGVNDGNTSDTRDISAGGRSGACTDRGLSENTKQLSGVTDNKKPSAVSFSPIVQGSMSVKQKEVPREDTELKGKLGDVALDSASGSNHQTEPLAGQPTCVEEPPSQAEAVAPYASGGVEDAQATDGPVDNDTMTLGEVAKQVSELLMLDGDEDDNKDLHNDDECEDVIEGFPSGISQTLKGCVNIHPKRNLYSNIDPREAKPLTDEKARILAELAAKKERVKNGILTHRQQLERSLSEQEEASAAPDWPVAGTAVNPSLSTPTAVDGGRRVPPLHPDGDVSCNETKGPAVQSDSGPEPEKTSQDILIKDWNCSLDSIKDLNRKMENISLSYKTMGKSAEVLQDSRTKASYNTKKSIGHGSTEVVSLDYHVQSNPETAPSDLNPDDSEKNDPHELPVPKKNKTISDNKAYKLHKQGKVIEKTGAESSRFRQMRENSGSKHHGVAAGLGQKSLSPFDLISATLHAWCTPSTLRFLLNFKSVDGEMSKEEFAFRYAELGKRVDRNEFEISKEDHLTTESAPASLSKLPDMKKLWVDTKAYDVHVHEFYKGSFTYRAPEECDIPEEMASESPPDAAVTIREKEIPAEPILPLVDSQAQMALRRRIVLDKLDRACPDLLAALHLSIQDVSYEMRLLVHTFKLTKDNITLKPAEWTVMAYMLLQLLAPRVAKVKLMLSQDTNDTFLTTLVNSIGVSHDDITKLVNDLTTVA